jgi:hypothetical protein
LGNTQQSEDETAKIFQEFVSSFDAEAKKKGGFVKAGVLVPGHKGMEVTESEQLYMPKDAHKTADGGALKGLASSSTSSSASSMVTSVSDWVFLSFASRICGFTFVLRTPNEHG